MSIRNTARAALLAAAVVSLPGIALAQEGPGAPVSATGRAQAAPGRITAVPGLAADQGEGADALSGARFAQVPVGRAGSPALEANQGEGAVAPADTFAGATLAQRAGRGGVL